ncbi:MAG: hypothetical protein HDT42_02495 [Ruminococcaceae bacterium]|nr:hypothetical protein [Oscillospiraceae bacterium]
MKKEVKDRLISEYDNLKHKERFTALKYCFRYNNVYVNIFFDNYDKNVPSMSMILAYNNKYYYTSLNIKNTAIRTEYFRKIPLDILERLLDENNHLGGFFESIETHILNSNKAVINYERDICFANTIRYSRSENDLPFLYSLRRTKMLNDTLEQLSETMGIDRFVLRKIQSEGFTIVRTDDVNKRKSLKAIIGNLDILIE